MHRYIAVILASAVLSACTLTPQGGGMRTEFNPPLVYRSWSAHTYTSVAGIKACAISSGYNGITVIVSGRDGENIAAKSDRPLVPGGMLDVNVSGNAFQTYEEFFPDSVAKRMAQSMTGGGKAYLEWYEESSTWGGAPQRVQTIIRLDGFAQQLKECRDLLHDGRS